MSNHSISPFRILKRTDRSKIGLPETDGHASLKRTDISWNGRTFLKRTDMSAWNERTQIMRVKRAFTSFPHSVASYMYCAPGFSMKIYGNSNCMQRTSRVFFMRLVVYYHCVLLCTRLAVLNKCVLFLGIVFQNPFSWLEVSRQKHYPPMLIYFLNGG